MDRSREIPLRVWPMSIAMKLRRILGGLAGGLAISACSFSAHAAFPATITSGSYTANLTGTGAMTAVGIGNSISFGHETLNSTVTSFNSVTSASGALNAQFEAGTGLIFDKVYFGGLTGGAIFNASENGAWADIDWTVNGGTFTGSTTHGGSNDGVGFAREWTITGPDTGSSHFYDGYWYQTVFYDFNNPVYGSGYYSIGASTFSMDITAMVGIWNLANARWAGGISPQGLSFGFTYLDAPVAAVPEPETYAMMLAGLGLLGFAARRRQQKHSET